MQGVAQVSSLGLDTDVYDEKTWKGDFAGAVREFVEEETNSQAEEHRSKSNTPSDDEGAFESEDVDDFFGGKDMVLDLDALWEAYEGYKDDHDALAASCRGKVLDRVWNGWDAALIVSKRGKAHHAVTQPNYGRNVAEKEDVTKVITPEEFEIHLGKRKAVETLEIEGRDVTIRKVSRLLRPYQKKEENRHLIELNFGKDKPMEGYSFDKKLEVQEPMGGKCKIQDRMIAKAVAALTLRVMADAELCFEKLLSEDAYKSIREIVFNSVTKFVLSIFDMEDFERIYNFTVVKDEYSTFFSSLCHCDCDPLAATAEGRVEFDEFSTLREHDLCDILRQYQDFAQDEDSEVEPWVFPIPLFKWNNISQSDITSAMTEMKKYVPLKEDCKTQLTLELTRRKCYHILDTLVLEVLKDIEIEELSTQCADTSRYEQSHYLEETVKELVEDANRALSCFAASIITALYTLASLKADELAYFWEALTFPLSHGKFGPCTEEVIEVIKIADQERRMQGERFISVQHILFGLSLSRVSECLKRILSAWGLKDFGGLPSKFSMFRVYMLSRDAATFLGDEAVGLEHLVLAIVFGKQEGDPISGATLEERISLFFDDNAWDAEVLASLRNSDTKSGVESWEDTDLFSKFLPKRCRDRSLVVCNCNLLIKGLRKAYKSGRLKFTAIRQENRGILPHDMEV